MPTLGQTCAAIPVRPPQVADVYRKVRFTLRYLLGNLADFDPQGETPALLHCLGCCHAQVKGFVVAARTS